MKSTALALPLAISLLMSVGSATAQDKEIIDIEALTCKQVMALSGVDRDTTMSFIHGYIAGKGGKTSIDVNALTDASEEFVDVCLDNPKSAAVATMEKLVSAP